TWVPGRWHSHRALQPWFLRPACRNRPAGARQRRRRSVTCGTSGLPRGQRSPDSIGKRTAAAAPHAHSSGGVAVSNTTGSAPVSWPVRAVRGMYSLTSRSNLSGPSTTARGPSTTRGLRLRADWNPPELRLILMPPPASQPIPTVTSPLTVSTSPRTRVSTRPMAPLTVSTLPPTVLPRSTNTPPLTVSISPRVSTLRPTRIVPLTVSRPPTLALAPTLMLPFTVLASPVSAPSPMTTLPLTVSSSPYALPAETSMLPLTLLMSSAAQAAGMASSRGRARVRMRERAMGPPGSDLYAPCHHAWLQSAPV